MTPRVDPDHPANAPVLLTLRGANPDGKPLAMPEEVNVLRLLTSYAAGDDAWRTIVAWE